MRLFAGCGIVADSIPEDELAESKAKVIPVRDALSQRDKGVRPRSRQVWGDRVAALEVVA